jgi:hypothetical protein
VRRLLLLAALLSGCAGTPRVETTATTFHGPAHEARGTIAVRAAEESVNQSLEFGAYRPKIEARLKAAGYTIAADHPEYVAVVAYGIDAGKTSIVTVPIYGQTGGGTSHSFGTVQGSGGPSSFSGTTYTAPTYGVVGATSEPVTQYTRAIAIDIVDAASLGGGAPKKRYEMRARSVGRCSTIGEVLEPMLEAMFEDFPGENGRPRTVRVAADVDC